MSQRIGVWDIETTGLKADFGRMLCFAWRWHGEDRVHLHSIVDTKAYKEGKPWDDRELVKILYSYLLEADLLVHHFGDRFDLKFAKTRLFEMGLTMPKVDTVDTWRVAKKNLLLQSNRLANIADFCGGEQKSGVAKRVWLKANFGHKASIRKLEQYCIQDVKTLDSIFTQMKSYVTKIVPEKKPAEKKSLGFTCTSCGSEKLQSRGVRISKAIGKYQRYHCQDCATWLRVGKKERLLACI